MHLPVNRGGKKKINKKRKLEDDEKSVRDSKRIDIEKLNNRCCYRVNYDVTRVHDCCPTPTFITNDKKGLSNISDNEEDGGKEKT